MLLPYELQLLLLFIIVIHYCYCYYYYYYCGGGGCCCCCWQFCFHTLRLLSPLPLLVPHLQQSIYGAKPLALLFVACLRGIAVSCHSGQ